jgi:hypothetical protein
LYFPISAVVSLVVTLATGETTEAAMVGKDGGIGIASALDGKVAVSRAIVQLGGDAMVCDPAAFRGAALQSETLISKIMRYEQTLFAQAQQSTACMANHEVDARLCRWCCEPATCREAITFLSRRNFWLRCSASAERA